MNKWRNQNTCSFLLNRRSKSVATTIRCNCGDVASRSFSEKTSFTPSPSSSNCLTTTTTRTGVYKVDNRMSSLSELNRKTAPDADEPSSRPSHPFRQFPSLRKRNAELKPRTNRCWSGFTYKFEYFLYDQPFEPHTALWSERCEIKWWQSSQCSGLRSGQSRDKWALKQMRQSESWNTQI